MQHVLKTTQPFFDRVFFREKNFEVRKDDRHFQSGDFVVLREYDQATNQYSGREVGAKITYVLRDYPQIEKGYVVFGIEIVYAGEK